ncbi:serine hydrolase-like protein isoform X1 [Takifugu rubripes]|uniref:serine hydrolase-like protein isoform X1 n=1 Tax=Takifugu rubripes TaxID=31033 RepID=UPI0011460AC2|nr:serine hydrolase-like protein isoform X1 [Takifugu rubripes]
MAKAESQLSVPVPWGELRGQVWGPDHGRPVLCLHGWADNCGSFHTLIPLLPKECRYVTMDLVGHGLSSHRPPGTFYSALDYVMDVRRVVEALQLQTFSIIGHSMGGDIAAVFAALYPDMVDVLILLDSFGVLPTATAELPAVMRRGIEELLHYEKRKERIYTYEGAVERMLAANPGLSKESVHVLLERGLVQREDGFVFSRDLRVNFKNIVRFSLEQSLEMLSRVQASVLIVLARDGSERSLSEPSQNELTSTLLQFLRDRDRTVVTVPGDHHAHLNTPEAVAPFVSEFLQKKLLTVNLPREEL